MPAIQNQSQNPPKSQPVASSSNIHQEPSINTIKETSSTEGSLSPPPAFFMESLMELWYRGLPPSLLGFSAVSVRPQSD